MNILLFELFADMSKHFSEKRVNVLSNRFYAHSTKLTNSYSKDTKV